MQEGYNLISLTPTTLLRPIPKIPVGSQPFVLQILFDNFFLNFVQPRKSFSHLQKSSLPHMVHDSMLQVSFLLYTFAENFLI